MGGQRRKKGGRVTPKGHGRTGRLTTEETESLEPIFAKLLRSVPNELTDDLPPVAVEMWASEMWSIWTRHELRDTDTVEVFGGGFIRYAARLGNPAALLALRAVAAVAPSPYGVRARREAERLAAGGVPEDWAWASVVGTGAPTEAWLSCDPVDDDGVSVMVGFDGPGEPSTVGVYIDHNLGGMAKDCFAAPAGIDQVLSRLQAGHDELGELEYRRISLAEAAARWRAAFEMTDMTLDPPVSADIDKLRALVMARLSRLPWGAEAPEPEPMGEKERERLVAEFLESDAVIGLWHQGEGGEDHEVEHLAHQAMRFSLDYVRGTPLRFSPTMVEIFCLDWAPRKIAGDGDAFTLLPDVLAAWIRFVGRRRGIPEESVKASVEAAYGYAPEMIELSQDAQNWGPAKTMVLAIQQRGIDISDQASLDRFVAEVNRSGGIDVLADSLVSSVAPRR